MNFPNRIEPPQLYDLLFISKDPMQSNILTSKEYALVLVVSTYFIGYNRVYQMKAIRKSWTILESCSISKQLKSKNDEASKM